MRGNLRGAVRGRSLAIAFALASCAIASASKPALAAGTAYGTDTAEVGDVGDCKIESWLSAASNGDFLGVSNPSCIVSLGHPVELSVQVQRSRADEEWGTTAAPKFKTNLLPSAIGRFGVAIAGGAMFDLQTQQNTGAFFYVPATLRLSDVVRINLNGGWLWDRIADEHYATYAAGIDWRTADNIWTITAEVFGQLGRADTASVTQPRFQVGMRFRPVDQISTDFIIGRNITGENANWFTVATTIRFPAPEKK